MSNDFRPGIQITADLIPSINYAGWQNAIPLLTSLRVENHSNQLVSNLKLVLESEPPFLESKTWLIDKLFPETELPIRDLDIRLDPKYLRNLNEAERGTVSFGLFFQSPPDHSSDPSCSNDSPSTIEREIARFQQDLRILAHNEWGGISGNLELLAAFVTPNDPGIPRILKRGSEILQQKKLPAGIDGYQSHDPNRAKLLAAVLWSAVAEVRLSYASPPASFELNGQKIRSVETVLQQGLATCLDTTLLFAAALEASGLHPIIVMQQEHCFVGCWLVPRTLRRMLEDECSEVRKGIATGELICFETTLVTQHPVPRFDEAIQIASRSLEERNEGKFRVALDIQRARMAQIRPLVTGSGGAGDREVDPFDPRGNSGGIPDPRANSEVRILSVEDSIPITPGGRKERWQRKLLDLTLRNRLLNFRPTAQSVPILCPDLGLLEDKLASDYQLRLISLPEENYVASRSSELFEQQTRKSLTETFTRAAWENNELPCDLLSAELPKRLTNIHRSVRNDLNEGGANTLYLALGFLRWRELDNKARSYRAPLILLPARLQRNSAASPYYLSRHEDDPCFNATLIQLLKRDFDCDLSGLELELPTDDQGIDVPQIFAQVRAAVRDIPGFELVEEMALARFSFAKYLMWSDLVRRSDQLEQNRVVRHLIQDPDQPFESAADFITDSSEVDQNFAPENLIFPLDADSSQLSAVLAAAQGNDFVLIGPPGTGKSQTIANMICQLLAERKTVLFVAEKTAALEVVFRRLNANGLSSCCIELHSNKAERKKFLEQLGASWQEKSARQPSQGKVAPDSPWLNINGRLKIRRDELNAYVRAIHRVYPNGWSPFEAMGLIARERQQAPLRFDWTNRQEHDRNHYYRLVDGVRQLASNFQAIRNMTPIPEIRTREWSIAWESRLLDDCQQLNRLTGQLQQSRVSLAASCGWESLADISVSQLEAIDSFARSLLGCRGIDVRIMFHPHFAQIRAAVRSLAEEIEKYQQLQQQLSAEFSLATIPRIPLDTLEVEWRKGTSSFWPFSWLARRKVTALLQTYATQGTVNPAHDLPLLRNLRQTLNSIEQQELSQHPEIWKGLDTDTVRLETELKRAEQLRSSLRNLTREIPRIDPQATCRTIYPALKGRNENLRVFHDAAEFRRAFKELAAFLKSFADTTGSPPLARDTPRVVQTLNQLAQKIPQHRRSLRLWTAWNEARFQAGQAGLQLLVEELEQGTTDPEELENRFAWGYANWWLPAIIDQDPALRTFRRFQHEEAIEDFRQLDQQARELAASVAKQAWLGKLPAMDSVPRRSELGMLRHQLGLRRPSLSIRQIVEGMPKYFHQLAPCLLMSPLSIAQYLSTDQTLFDVVIFDEASQITTWDAIGAVARGKQTIIVGDPKQLPPTNFFGIIEDDSEDEDLQDHERDLESILDEATASGLPTLRLNWHYRSRHESLIAFSNQNYYHNQLITFPGAQSAEKGLVLVRVDNAVYQRGGNRTNQTEAEAIVAELVGRMKQELTKSESRRRTFGVITFNIQQQTLIQDLLDQAQCDDPALDWFFSEDRTEPTIVKNLENVQGDERDVIYFSITFGFDANSQRRDLPLNFGALNREGGERRLNVAITRAKEELRVFCSFHSDDIRSERSRSRGVRDLKMFLAFAESCNREFSPDRGAWLASQDSALTQAITGQLQERGWQVVPSIGVSDLKITLGIVHPHDSSRYLAAIECDGETYRRAATARDRDKTRPQVLQGLGWEILRVWSPELWYDSEATIESLDRRLRELLEESLPSPAAADF
jgi:hypothetical protein